MHFQKWILGSVLAFASVGLIACGGDSSSSGDGTSSGDLSSSSYSEPVTVPGTSDESPVVISNFGSIVTSDSVTFKGSISIDYSVASSDSVYLDSVAFVLSTADGYVLDNSGFHTNAVTYSERQQLNIGIELHPALSLWSFDACGDFVVYIIAYADGKRTVDSTTFSKASENYCVEVESSSSSEAVALIPMSAWTVTLTTNAVGYVGIDLDTKTSVQKVSLAANKDAVDLVITYEDRVPALMNASEAASIYTDLSGATSVASITEETSGKYDAVNLPADPVYTSDFSYYSSSLGDYVEDPGYGEYWVVTTPSFDSTTMKGFFVIMTGQATLSSSDVSIPLTIWSVE